MVHLRRVHVVDAPWEKVWPKLAEAAASVQAVGPVLADAETTVEPGIGSRIEWRDGPLAGSRASRTVTDEQGSTRLVLEGDFTVPEGMTAIEVLAMVETMEERSVDAIRRALADVEIEPDDQPK